jgi:hypothetical protein
MEKDHTKYLIKCLSIFVSPHSQALSVPLYSFKHSLKCPEFFYPLRIYHALAVLIESIYCISASQFNTFRRSDFSPFHCKYEVAYEVSIFLSIMTNQDYVPIPLNHQIHIRRHCEVQIEPENRSIESVRIRRLSRQSIACTRMPVRWHTWTCASVKSVFPGHLPLPLRL